MCNNGNKSDKDNKDKDKDKPKELYSTGSSGAGGTQANIALAYAAVADDSGIVAAHLASSNVFPSSRFTSIRHLARPITCSVLASVAMRPLWAPSTSRAGQQTAVPSPFKSITCSMFPIRPCTLPRLAKSFALNALFNTSRIVSESAKMTSFASLQDNDLYYIIVVTSLIAMNVTTHAELH